MQSRRRTCDRGGRHRVAVVCVLSLSPSTSTSSTTSRSSQAMATRKVADHTLYHLSPKGFWKKFSA